jgi:hypothetical protein
MVELSESRPLFTREPIYVSFCFFGFTEIPSDNNFQENLDAVIVVSLRLNEVTHIAAYASGVKTLPV